VKESKASGLVLFPDLEFGFLFEDPHEDRRFLRHVLAFDLGQHPIRQRLHVAAVDCCRRAAVRIATGKRQRRRNRS